MAEDSKGYKPTTFSEAVIDQLVQQGTGGKQLPTREVGEVLGTPSEPKPARPSNTQGVKPTEAK